jgi:hypothetical protein
MALQCQYCLIRWEIQMQNEKKQVAKLQKDDRLFQRPLEYLKSNYDSLLWYQTPEIGIEGLIAIIDSEKKLLIAIKQQVIDKKNNSWRRGKFMRQPFGLIPERFAMNLD